jgi:ATP cone domain/Restriction endonuclease
VCCSEGRNLTNEINVRKWDKSREPYNRDKIIKTMRRYGLNDSQIEDVLEKVERQHYNGITTKKLHAIIKDEIEKSEHQVKRSDLREGLALMRSAPDFEKYVQALFRGLGYEVTSNRVIQGFCVTHEIDGVAVKDGKQYYIETKHHAKLHNRTPFIDSLAVKAKLDDIRHGYATGKNDYDFDKAILICNTKMTKHAEDYSRCVDIEHIGWNMPRGRGIDELIEESRVYPYTVIPKLTRAEIRRLSSLGVVTVRDILDVNLSGLEKGRARIIKDQARRIMD